MIVFYKIVLERIIDLKARINELRIREPQARNEEEAMFLREQIMFAKDMLELNEAFEKELLKVVK